MAGHIDIDEHEHTRSAGAISTHPRSFAARAGSYPGFSRSNTDPSGESLAPHNRYRDGMTIRAVTPEPELGFEGYIDDSTAPAYPTTTPPRTPSRSAARPVSKWGSIGRLSPELAAPPSPERSRNILNRTSMTAQLAELTISRAKSRSPTERHFSPDDTRYDVGSPAGTPYVVRHRYHPSQVVLDTGGLPMSVGYPSTQTVQQTPPRPQTGKSGRHRLLRPSNSVNTLQSQPARLFADQPPPTSPTSADFDSLVQLMKRLRGRMNGYVEFRLGDNRNWIKGYCLIDIGTGSLLYQRDEVVTSAPPDVIIPDLRGCQVKASLDDSDGTIDLSTHSLKIEMKLRPLSVQQYDQWLAALLCWSPIRPAGAQNKMIKSQIPVLTNGKRRTRSASDATVRNRSDGTIIKVGKMLLWSPSGPTASAGPPSRSSGKAKLPQGGVSWQSVSCTLQENGEFQLSRDLDSQTLAIVQLSQLSRCAVQQLDPSILDQDFCIAIYLQYTPNPRNQSQARPVYLGIDTRILFEVWFVLLRAFTMPEIYGPATRGAPASGLETINAGSITDSRSSSSSSSNNSLVDSYRIHRGLFLRVVEAKIGMGPNSERESGLDCYAEVVLDGEARAKTMVRTKTHNPFWREDYEFPDLPTVLTDVAVVLKQRDPRWKTKIQGTVAGSGGFGGGLGGVSLPGNNDAVIGRVDVKLDEFCGEKNEFERWLPLTNTRGDGVEERVGEMYLRAETEELIVLMSSEYNELSKVCPSLTLTGMNCTDGWLPLVTSQI